MFLGKIRFFVTFHPGDAIKFQIGDNPTLGDQAADIGAPSSGVVDTLW